MSYNDDLSNYCKRNTSRTVNSRRFTAGMFFLYPRLPTLLSFQFMKTYRKYPAQWMGMNAEQG
jgi:hypothetical protein